MEYGTIPFFEIKFLTSLALNIPPLTVATFHLDACFSLWKNKAKNV